MNAQETKKLNNIRKSFQQTVIKIHNEANRNATIVIKYHKNI